MKINTNSEHIKAKAQQPQGHIEEPNQAAVATVEPDYEAIAQAEEVKNIIGNLSGGFRDFLDNIVAGANQYRKQNFANFVTSVSKRFLEMSDRNFSLNPSDLLPANLASTIYKIIRYDPEQQFLTIKEANGDVFHLDMLNPDFEKNIPVDFYLLGIKDVIETFLYDKLDDEDRAAMDHFLSTVDSALLHLAKKYPNKTVKSHDDILRFASSSLQCKIEKDVSTKVDELLRDPKLLSDAESLGAEIIKSSHSLFSQYVNGLDKDKVPGIKWIVASDIDYEDKLKLIGDPKLFHESYLRSVINLCHHTINQIDEQANLLESKKGDFTIHQFKRQVTTGIMSGAYKAYKSFLDEIQDSVNYNFYTNYLKEADKTKAKAVAYLALGSKFGIQNIRHIYSFEAIKDVLFGGSILDKKGNIVGKVKPEISGDLVHKTDYQYNFEKVDAIDFKKSYLDTFKVELQNRHGAMFVDKAGATLQDKYEPITGRESDLINRLLDILVYLITDKNKPNSEQNPRIRDRDQKINEIKSFMRDLAKIENSDLQSIQNLIDSDSSINKYGAKPNIAEYGNWLIKKRSGERYIYSASDFANSEEELGFEDAMLRIELDAIIASLGGSASSLKSEHKGWKSRLFAKRVKEYQSKTKIERQAILAEKERQLNKISAGSFDNDQFALKNQRTDDLNKIIKSLSLSTVNFKDSEVASDLEALNALSKIRFKPKFFDHKSDAQNTASLVDFQEMLGDIIKIAKDASNIKDPQQKQAIFERQLREKIFDVKNFSNLIDFVDKALNDDYLESFEHDSEVKAMAVLAANLYCLALRSLKVDEFGASHYKPLAQNKPQQNKLGSPDFMKELLNEKELLNLFAKNKINRNLKKVLSYGKGSSGFFSVISNMHQKSMQNYVNKIETVIAHLSDQISKEKSDSELKDRFELLVLEYYQGLEKTLKDYPGIDYKGVASKDLIEKIIAVDPQLIVELIKKVDNKDEADKLKQALLNKTSEYAENFKDRHQESQHFKEYFANFLFALIKNPVFLNPNSGLTPTTLRNLFAAEYQTSKGGLYAKYARMLYGLTFKLGSIHNAIEYIAPGLVKQIIAAKPNLFNSDSHYSKQNEVLNESVASVIDEYLSKHNQLFVGDLSDYHNNKLDLLDKFYSCAGILNNNSYYSLNNQFEDSRTKEDAEKIANIQDTLQRMPLLCENTLDALPAGKIPDENFLFKLRKDKLKLQNSLLDIKNLIPYGDKTLGWFKLARLQGSNGLENPTDLHRENFDIRTAIENIVSRRSNSDKFHFAANVQRNNRFGLAA